MKLIAIQPRTEPGSKPDGPRVAIGPGLEWCGEVADLKHLRLPSTAVWTVLGEADPALPAGRVCYVETWGQDAKALLNLE